MPFIKMEVHEDFSFSLQQGHEPKTWSECYW